ncbi:transporter substrate-binding domain-containing protein [Microvirga arsenatis]|uniref:Transporter substrate-binding domain-containing protein n=1 Tax=Microvirga arsenatis TaxID=2692265 RepID=A0ABW9Z421_9HYPH|nr:transporter substrate-binding domain-containing protein [Microvirga arsenatis]NBJ12596.1 transporter substrate-binding domain-containing protein [Microvirga arsenatis]NBJ26455.1 transporter substrate-binding domain-containing protein [Microvirga arsenatis]
MLLDIVTLVARFRRKIKPLSRAVLPLLLTIGAAQAQGVSIPNFWDPRAQLDRPDLPATRTVRFLVDDDFPPLHFPGLDGNPTGLSVELARAACERLGLTCTVQVRRFDTLLDALAERQGDVVAAAVPITASLRQRFAVTGPYFKIPARFAVRKDRNQPAPDVKALQGKTVGVVGGTAHEAYAKAFMAGASLKPYPELAAAQTALKAGEIDYLFADGLGLALWIGGEEAAGCCDFSGGPYLESRFFGEGIGFVTRSDDESLRRALDFALHQLWREGRYAELYLRFFPVSPY